MEHTLEEVFVDVLFRDDHVLPSCSSAKSFKLHPKDIKRIQPIPANQIAQEAVS